MVKSPTNEGADVGKSVVSLRLVRISKARVNRPKILVRVIPQVHQIVQAQIAK